MYRFGTAASMKNSWKHLAFSMNRTTKAVRVYTNGLLQQTFTSSVTAPDNLSQAQFMHTGNISSGTAYTSIYTSLKGYVDDYRIYNSVLTDDQILSIFNE
jgi:hypothetical protein